MQTSEEVQALFDNLRPASFRETREQVGYERVAGQGEIQPQGWVINKDATVVIDESGLIIEDGALRIVDASGSSVMDASGFSGSWTEFIHGGVYNGNFSRPLGNTAALTAVTEIGGGDTLDEYIASWSAIPFWVVRSLTGNVNYQKLGSGSSSVFEFQGTGATNANAVIYTDVPVVAGRSLTVFVLYGYTSLGAVGTNRVKLSYRLLDLNHTPIDTEQYLNDHVLGAGSNSDIVLLGQLVTGDAAYVRVLLTIEDMDIPLGAAFRFQDVIATHAGPLLALTNGATAYGAWEFKSTPRWPSYGTSASRSTTQTINNATTTAITFTTQDHDSMNGFTSPSTDITVQRAGRYHVVGKAQFDQATAGTRRIILIYVNGVAVTEHTYEKAAELFDIHMNIYDNLPLNVNDVVTLRVNQNTGGTLNIDSASLKLYYMGDQ